MLKLEGRRPVGPTHEGQGHIVTIGLVRVVDPEGGSVRRGLVPEGEDLVVETEAERVRGGRPEEAEGGQPSRVDRFADPPRFPNGCPCPGRLRAGHGKEVEADGECREAAERIDLARGDLSEERAAGRRWRGPRRGKLAALEPVADGQRHPTAQAVGNVADPDPEVAAPPRERGAGRPAVGKMEPMPARAEARDARGLHDRQRMPDRLEPGCPAGRAPAPCPRPRPTMPDMAAAQRHTNRLAGETSPYLLQHAHNPVDWYPWGPDALARAKLLDRPIFLSIGYAACHWCHVMERESFEDPGTAAILNAGFVAIKVDREERPDLDQVYMAAVQAMTGGGGWPMSVFLTPEGRPFYGGTYFPDEPRHGMPSFRQVLEGVLRAWRDQRPELEQAGLRLIGALVDQARTTAPPALGADAPTPGLLEEAARSLEAGFDWTNGGWGRAPKFPQPMTIEFLLRRAATAAAETAGAAGGEPAALEMARRALDAMADGGIHDHLGGGFHRYATDSAWLVPHFEAMLYDNAQLARVYLLAWALTGDARYRAVATGTLDFIRRELTMPDGAFAASLDADTGGVEGATYTWTLREIGDLLGDDAGLFAAAYGVTEAGNWEGVTILSRVRSTADLCRELDMEPDEVERRLGDARRRLLEHRATRTQPARDGKALAAWNGLAIRAFADAARLLGDRGERTLAATYEAAAVRAASTIVDGLLGASGRLARSWKDGRAVGPGVLEDHADLADGLLALYEATFDERWFVVAVGLADTILDRFADPAGGFFDVADDHERLVTRPKDLQDNALPAGGSTAARVLLRLAAWTGDGRYRTAAESAVGGVTALAARYPTAFANWLSAAELAVAGIDEVAVVGDPADPATRRLLAVLAERPLAPLVVAVAADPATSAIPLLGGRIAIEGRPTAYACRGFVCRLPVTEPGALRAALEGRAEPELGGGR